MKVGDIVHHVAHDGMFQLVAILNGSQYVIRPLNTSLLGEARDMIVQQENIWVVAEAVEEAGPHMTGSPIWDSLNAAQHYLEQSMAALEDLRDALEDDEEREIENRDRE